MKISEAVNKFFQKTCHLPDKSVGGFKRAAIIVGLALFHTLTLGTVVIAHTVRNHSCCSKPVNNFDQLMGQVLLSCGKDGAAGRALTDRRQQFIEEASHVNSTNGLLMHILHYVKTYDDYEPIKPCIMKLDDLIKGDMQKKLESKKNRLLSVLKDVSDGDKEHDNDVKTLCICEKLLGLFEEINQLES